ncbi:MAG: sulfite dehydrogenase [Myxococcota bacterium]
MKTEWTRRKLLAALGGAGATMVASSTPTTAAAERAADAGTNATPAGDPTKTPGAGPSPVGARSPFAEIKRLDAFGVISSTPLQDLHGTMTPSDLHFERHHAGIPQIDPAQHALYLHGFVERPLKFSMRDLLRLPAVTRTCFLECSGNLMVNAKAESTPQMICGLTSQSEWTGVALSTLLREAGVQDRARWMLAEGSDAAILSRSIPIEKAMDDAIIAYAQNGESLRPAQGYPLRLLLPGWEGNTNVKWLRRLEFSDRPFMTREETSKYSEPIKGGQARQFSFTMDARSVITSPTYPAELERGWQEIRGIAWSGRGKIARVEVSVDGGKRWTQAKLAGPILPKAHTRFRLPWRWNGGEAELVSRAIDETGYVQPTRRALIDARGIGSLPYHLNPQMAWLVQTDGRVLYRADPWA